MGSDETSPVPEIEGIARHCSSGCDTCLVGLAELPSPSPPPHHHHPRLHHLLALSHSAGEEHALFLCAPQPPCSCPLTVSLQYFSIPITGTVGDPLPFNVAASHPGVTTCQGTLSLWPQLLSPSRLRNANPFLLIHEAPEAAVVHAYTCAIKY